MYFSLRWTRLLMMMTLDEKMNYWNNHIAQWNFFLIVGSLKVISSLFWERVSIKLYHLKLLIKTTQSNISLEKNEVITISPYKMIHNAENLHVSFPHGITMNILLQNTKIKWKALFFHIRREITIVKILFLLFYNRTNYQIHETYFLQNNLLVIYFQKIFANSRIL